MPSTIQRAPRVKMVLPLRVCTHEAKDAAPVIQLAHTVEISRGGCRLGGLRTELASGQTITLQRGKHKASFRVVWSKKLALHEHQAGIELMERDKNIWDVELPGSSVPSASVSGMVFHSEGHSAPKSHQNSRRISLPRLRWSFGLLFLAMILGLSFYCLRIYATGASVMPLLPHVPSAPKALARLTPRHMDSSSLAKHWDSSVSRLQVAEAPTGHVVYPVAPQEGRRGKVNLQIAIAPSGLVKEVYALSGQRSLAEAAAEAVHSWHYRPFSGAHPAERATTVTVSFLGSDAVFMEFPSSTAPSASSKNLMN